MEISGSDPNSCGKKELSTIFPESQTDYILVRCSEGHRLTTYVLCHMLQCYVIKLIKVRCLLLCLFVFIKLSAVTRLALRILQSIFNIHLDNFLIEKLLAMLKLVKILYPPCIQFIGNSIGKTFLQHFRQE